MTVGLCIFCWVSIKKGLMIEDEKNAKFQAHVIFAGYILFLLFFIFSFPVFLFVFHHYYIFLSFFSLNPKYSLFYLIWFRVWLHQTVKRENENKINPKKPQSPPSIFKNPCFLLPQDKSIWKNFNFKILRKEFFYILLKIEGKSFLAL